MPSRIRPKTLRGRPPTGRAQSAAERMRRYRVRRRAAGLRTVTRYEAPAQALPAGALKHRIIEARSLAMHCLTAQKIERDPGLLDRVRQTLATWRGRYTSEGAEVPRALDEWQRHFARAVARDCRADHRCRRARHAAAPVHAFCRPADV